MQKDLLRQILFLFLCLPFRKQAFDGTSQNKKGLSKAQTLLHLSAVRGGFEPPVRLNTVRRFSKPVISATHPPNLGILIFRFHKIFWLLMFVRRMAFALARSNVQRTFDVHLTNQFPSKRILHSLALTRFWIANLSNFYLKSTIFLFYSASSKYKSIKPSGAL